MEIRMTSNDKINQLVNEFSKNHDFDSQELKDGISVLERFNWDVQMTAIIVKLNLDHGKLISYEDVDFIDDIFIEKLQNSRKEELSSEEKISRIKKFFKEGYCSFDYNKLEKVINILEL